MKHSEKHPFTILKFNEKKKGTSSVSLSIPVPSDCRHANVRATIQSTGHGAHMLGAYGCRSIPWTPKEVRWVISVIHGDTWWYLFNPIHISFHMVSEKICAPNLSNVGLPVQSPPGRGSLQRQPHHCNPWPGLPRQSAIRRILPRIFYSIETPLDAALSSSSSSPT